MKFKTLFYSFLASLAFFFLATPAFAANSCTVTNVGTGNLVTGVSTQLTVKITNTGDTIRSVKVTVSGNYGTLDSQSMSGFGSNVVGNQAWFVDGNVINGTDAFANMNYTAPSAAGADHMQVSVSDSNSGSFVNCSEPDDNMFFAVVDPPSPTPGGIFDPGVSDVLGATITQFQGDALSNLGGLIPIAAVVFVTVAIIFLVIRWFRKFAHV